VVVRVIPLVGNLVVLILRYPACPGEDLLPYETYPHNAPPEARERVRRDVRTLAERGYAHPFSRGPAHWLVSSKTGTIVFDSWYCLREVSPQESEYLLGRVDRLLDFPPPPRPSRMRRGLPPATTAGSPAMTTTPDRLRETFGRSRVFLPVIHPVEWDAALAAVELVVAADAPGIFLINQGLDAEDVLRLVLQVRRKHPLLWVGVNLLGYSPAQALEAALAACEGRLDGLWSDNAGIDESQPPERQPAGLAFAAARERLGWKGLYFGGVAFKYQRPVAHEALPAAARAAAPYLDVLCTSGPGTGQKADVAKIEALHAAGALPLALASGVTVDNVANYLPYVSAFLVGTGIEHQLGILDPVRVTALAQAIASYPE
jgi:hypothetical protein